LTRDDLAAVRVTVEMSADQLVQLRPGATILARIHCGRKTLAYVWFHDVIHAIRQWIWM
jgi:hypothetical protein